MSLFIRHTLHNMFISTLLYFVFSFYVFCIFTRPRASIKPSDKLVPNMSAVSEEFKRWFWGLDAWRNFCVRPWPNKLYSNLFSLYFGVATSCFVFIFVCQVLPQRPIEIFLGPRNDPVCNFYIHIYNPFNPSATFWVFLSLIFGASHMPFLSLWCDFWVIFCRRVDPRHETNFPSFGQWRSRRGHFWHPGGQRPAPAPLQWHCDIFNLWMGRRTNQ